MDNKANRPITTAWNNWLDEHEDQQHLPVPSPPWRVEFLREHLREQAMVARDVDADPQVRAKAQAGIDRFLEDFDDWLVEMGHQGLSDQERAQANRIS